MSETTDESCSTERRGQHWQEKREREWGRQREIAQRILNEYDAPEYGVVLLQELRIDERYQRARSEAKVHTLRAKFCPNACQPLAVSHRPDGTRFLVDGQHRAAVLDDIGVKSWPALIYRNLTRRDEAAMWSELNTRQTKPNPNARFRAALVSKDPEALAIDGLVRAAGFSISTWRGRGPRKNQIDAVEAIVRIYHQMRAAGLTDVLTLLAAAWPDPEETDRTQRLVLLGLAAFLSGEWAPRIQRARAVEVVGQYRPCVWMAKTRGMTSGESPPAILGEKIRAAYNKKAPKSEKL